LLVARFGFGRAPFAVALFEAVFRVADAFDAAALAAVPASTTVSDVADLGATVLRDVGFLGGAFLTAVRLSVAVRAAAFLVALGGLEAFAPAGLADSAIVLAPSRPAGTALRPRCFRPEVARFAGRFGSPVAPLPLDPKASVTTASASSNVSWRVSIVACILRSSFLRSRPRGDFAHPQANHQLFRSGDSRLEGTATFLR
jgi:hypothetical protein